MMSICCGSRSNGWRPFSSLKRIPPDAVPSIFPFARGPNRYLNGKNLSPLRAYDGYADIYYIEVP